MQSARRYFLASVIMFSLLAPQAQGKIFDFIVSDSDMTDTMSMSRETLRRFLIERGTLGKVSFPDIDGTVRPAHDIIYRAALRHGVNPKFLLVLLQREQSLVEDPTPTQDQYDWAMGYAVCDSCSKTDPRIQPFRGFANQVENAAERIQELVTHGIGFQVGQEIVIDGVPVTPETKATAALYTYTPHLHGNTNFRDIWRRYFLMRYPDGTLLQARGEPAIYLIHYGRKRAFTSMASLTSRYDPKNIIQVGKSDLDPYESGPLISFPNYSLLQAPDESIYLLVDDTLRPIDRETFRLIGYAPDELIPISDEDRDAYTIGAPLNAEHPNLTDELLQAPNGGIFAVRDGVRHPILSPEILKDRYSGFVARKATLSELNALPVGEPVAFRNGTLIKATASPVVYLVSNGVRRPILSEAAFRAYGFDFRDVVSTTRAAVELHPLGNPIAMPDLGLLAAQ